MGTDASIKGRHFANVYELQERLHELGVDLSAKADGSVNVHASVKKLKRWAYQENLISRPGRRSLGKGLGTISLWSTDALAEAAGVWVLRGGNKRRKTPRVVAIKKVQQFAREVYARPRVRLELPDDTDENEDPPLEQVELTFDYPRLPSDVNHSFLKRYVMTAEKVVHGLHVEDPVIITFEWADPRPMRRRGKESVLPLSNATFIQTTTEKGANGDNLRVCVDGKDVRGVLLTLRRHARTLRGAQPEVYRKWGLMIPKVTELQFAPKPLRIESDATFESITKEYKGEATESDLRTMRALAFWQEENQMPVVQEGNRKTERGD
jgi:post-segregation antitoxin (ccd killing protein)